MKFECDKTKIEMAIQKTARLANKHLTLPVLSCVYLNKNSAIIKCLPYEDFPSIPKLENSKSIKINCRDLISGFKSVWYSASNSNIKPELSSVYVYKNNENLVFVSTDSFRLAEKTNNTKNIQHNSYYFERGFIKFYQSIKCIF